MDVNNHNSPIQPNPNHQIRTTPNKYHKYSSALTQISKNFQDQFVLQNIKPVFKGKKSLLYTATTPVFTQKVVIKHAVSNKWTQKEVAFLEKAYESCPEYTLPILHYQVTEMDSGELYVGDCFEEKQRSHSQQSGSCSSRHSSSFDSNLGSSSLSSDELSRESKPTSPEKIVTIVQPLFGQSLFDQMASTKKTLTTTDLRFVYYQIITALNQLQKAGIYHLDIKEENVLIDSETKKIKLIDFGVARSSPVPKGIKIGSTEFCSPEVILGYSCQNSLSKHDVWSVGVSLFSSFTGKLPYKNVENVVLGSEKISLRDVVQKMKRDGEELQNIKSFVMIMCGMFELFHVERISFDNLLRSGWFYDEEVYRSKMAVL